MYMAVVGFQNDYSCGKHLAEVKIGPCGVRRTNFICIVLMKAGQVREW